MIASVAFRNFKALRNTQLVLAPFNLIIGPNGSGKTSLIQALTRLRDLARSSVVSFDGTGSSRAEELEVSFQFTPPHADVQARLSCSAEFVCDLLQVKTPQPEEWEAARQALLRLRTYVFDHRNMTTGGSQLSAQTELAIDGANIAAVLAARKESAPEAFAMVQTEFCRVLPEFSALDFPRQADGAPVLVAVLRDGSRVPAENLSQGTLYALCMLALAFDPDPPSLLCIEEIDRGIHPRLLREVRDALYRLSYPRAFGLTRSPVQVVATTHSPYLLDLFRDHPEEVVIAQKNGQEARFSRLADRADLHELLQEGTLGDMWYAGILGGVPEEETYPERG